MNIGIEMEFWVVDDEGRLCDGTPITDAHELIKPEFIEPLIEVRTTPHERKASLTREFRRTLQTAIWSANDTGKHLVPLGTPLTTADPPAISTRGELFEQIYGEGVQSAKNAAGTHIHFEREHTLRQLNLLTALDPALALVNSSPYYCGERHSSSSRAFAYRKLCGAPFKEFCDLWPYTASVQSWESRVDNEFTAFKQLGSARGVPPSEINRHFDAEDAVLTPVRLRRSLPTVEWRAPDTALPSQTIDLAFDMLERIEETATKPVEVGEVGVTGDRIGIPTFAHLHRLSTMAIRNGLDAPPVVQYLERMGFDTDAYDPISRSLVGPASLSKPHARRIRLEYARELRADVRSLLPESAPAVPVRTVGKAN